MTNIVKFQDKELELVSHNNQQYMTLSQIGIVLEYANPRKVSKLYNEHKSEFDEEMSCLIKKGNTRVRLFNREGAWLIGMFARTPKAAEFRKWVLKVLGGVADSGGYATVANYASVAAPVDMKAIGGMVKRCTNLAVKQAIKEIFATPLEIYENDVVQKHLYSISDKDMMDTFSRWYIGKNYDLYKVGWENVDKIEKLEYKLSMVEKAIKS